jgi:peptidoglycan hydrolase FlgJ
MKIPPVSPPTGSPPVADTSNVSDEEKAALQKVSEGFEAIFVNQMVGEMRKTVEKGGLVPESQAERIYSAMLDQEFSSQIASSQQIGLSKMIYDHLLRNRNSR